MCFTRPEDALQAIEQVSSDYDRHSEAALAIAREYFGGERVLGEVMREIGVE